MARIHVWLIVLLFSVPAVGQDTVRAVRNAPAPVPPPRGGNTLIPPWVPLAGPQQEHVNQVLAYWEFTTNQVKRYRCRFKRWEYEPDLKTYSEGVIKYAAPDKGLFQVESLKHRTPPAEPGGPPRWAPQQDGFREHWVCDGKSVFEFDYRNKQLKQRPLPPELQGKQIAEGPLPFLFGAKADQIRARFWIRVTTPKEVKKEYWLEAWPKTQRDAANFRQLLIILDEDDFLPKGMKLTHRNAAETTFVFEQRETNWNMLATQLNPFLREFFEPKTPSGWQKVVEPLTPAGVSPRGAARIQPGRGPLNR